MKKALVFIVFTILPFIVFSQKQYKISFDDYQTVEEVHTSLGNLIKFPYKDNMIVMGGLNNLSGLSNYFDVFGNKLIVDKMDVASNGIRHVVLRREDGRNFYGLFPALSAKLIPLTHSTEDKKSIAN